MVQLARQLSHGSTLRLATRATDPGPPSEPTARYYLAYTVANARRVTEVVAPGVWMGGQFDRAQTFRGELRKIAIY